MTTTTHLRWLKNQEVYKQENAWGKSYGNNCKAVLQPQFDASHKMIHMARDKGIQAQTLIIPATADCEIHSCMIKFQ